MKNVVLDEMKEEKLNLEKLLIKICLDLGIKNDKNIIKDFFEKQSKF